MKRAAVNHTKMLRLARRLRIQQWGAVGIMETLWNLTAREAPDGDLSRLSAEDIALHIDWRGDPGRLIEALVDCRWLDREGERLLVHDWDEHADAEVHRKLARAGKFFASGKIPNFGRLTRVELEAAKTAFGEEGERTAYARRTHGLRPSQSQSQSQSQSLSQCQSQCLSQSQQDRAPGGRPEEAEPAAGEGGKNLDALLRPLRRLYPPAKFDEGDTRSALAIVLGEDAEADPPTPEGLAAALAAWRLSGDWSDEGGRFVPPSRTWVLRRDFRKSPRRPRDPALDPGGWKFRQLVADALEPTETAA